MKKSEALLRVLHDTKLKRKKVLLETPLQYRDDLEQEMLLKVIEAVKEDRIEKKNFWDFKKEIDQKNKP